MDKNKIVFSNPPKYCDVVEKLEERNAAYTVDEDAGCRRIKVGSCLYEFNNNDFCVRRISPNGSILLSYNENNQVDEIKRKSLKVGSAYELSMNKIEKFQYDENNRICKVESSTETCAVIDGCETYEDKYQVKKFKYLDDGFLVEIFDSCEKIDEEGRKFESNNLTTCVCDKNGNIIKEIDSKKAAPLGVIVNECKSK